MGVSREEIHTLMWRAGLTQRQLGDLIGVDQGAISKRLRGKIEWAAWEVSAAAAWLNVDVADLIPAVEVVETSNDANGDDIPADGAPSRTRTYDLRIRRAKVQPRAAVAA